MLRKVPQSRVQKHLLQKNQVAKQQRNLVMRNRQEQRQLIRKQQLLLRRKRQIMDQQKTITSENANPDDQAKQVLNQLANMFPGQGLPQAILTSQTNNF